MTLKYGRDLSSRKNINSDEFHPIREILGFTHLPPKISRNLIKRRGDYKNHWRGLIFIRAKFSLIL